MAVKKAIVLGTDGLPQQLQAGDTLFGAGGASITETVVVAPYGSMLARVTVVDAAISPSSKIIVDWGAVTDFDENDPETCPVSMRAIPGTGQFDVVLSAMRPFGGALRLNYLAS